MVNINPNGSALPHTHLSSCPSCGGGGKAGSAGLTIRAHFAAMAMQGLLSDHNLTQALSGDIAEMAVEAADALIAELNK